MDHPQHSAKATSCKLAAFSSETLLFGFLFVMLSGFIPAYEGVYGQADITLNTPEYYTPRTDEAVEVKSNFPDFIDPEASYIWPTDASDYFSATFGETRSAHFHAAADIGTWGREGYEVYATRAGLLYRVGVSASGYGNVVYLRHDDGSFSVYAHLQDFNPQIRALVDSTRFRTYSHAFDSIVAEAGIRFQQGETIGRTGSTGIGPPHLHFELRSPQNAAFNPKLVGISIEDEMAPRFSSLAVIPFAADALVSSSKNILQKRPRIRGGVFDFGTVEAEGTIGLAINASDRSNNGRNVYAVYELIMEVNGKAYFHSKADSFAMQDSRQMLIDRVYPLLLARQGGYQRLHILDGNTLPFYNRELGDGKLRLPPGRHQVEIIARDFEGNEARARLNLDISETAAQSAFGDQSNIGEPRIPSAMQQEHTHPESSFRWTKNWIAPLNQTHHSVESGEAGAFGTMKTRHGQLTAHEAITLQGERTELYSHETGAFTLHRLVPGQRRQLQFPAYRMRLDFAPNAVFDTTYVHVKRWQHAENGQTRDRIRIAPENVPLQGNYELLAVLPDSLADNPKVGLYFVNERRNRYDYMSSEILGNLLRAGVRGFGTFEVRQDTTAPELNRPRLWRRRADGQWFVSVRAFDLESGIDYNNAVFTVNGQRGIAEFDPFGNRMHFHHPGFTPRRGSNEVRIVVSDYAGNTTEAEFQLNH